MFFPAVSRNRPPLLKGKQDSPRATACMQDGSGQQNGPSAMARMRHVTRPRRPNDVDKGELTRFCNRCSLAPDIGTVDLAMYQQVCERSCPIATPTLYLLSCTGAPTIAMSQPYIISISSDEEDDGDDVQILDFQRKTQELILQPPPKTVKKLSDSECPICFDTIENATTTFCGHVYCLECLQRSLSSSSARGQTRGRKGVGLCPMCRKTVSFKDTVVLRLRTGAPVEPPKSLLLEKLKSSGAGAGDSEDEIPIPGAQGD